MFLCVFVCEREKERGGYLLGSVLDESDDEARSLACVVIHSSLSSIHRFDSTRLDSTEQMISNARQFMCNFLLVCLADGIGLKIEKVGRVLNAILKK